MWDLPVPKNPIGRSPPFPKINAKKVKMRKKTFYTCIYSSSSSRVVDSDGLYRLFISLYESVVLIKQMIPTCAFSPTGVLSSGLGDETGYDGLLRRDLRV